MNFKSSIVVNLLQHVTSIHISSITSLKGFRTPSALGEEKFHTIYFPYSIALFIQLHQTTILLSLTEDKTLLPGMSDASSNINRNLSSFFLMFLGNALKSFTDCINKLLSLNDLILVDAIQLRRGSLMECLFLSLFLLFRSIHSGKQPLYHFPVIYYQISLFFFFLDMLKNCLLTMSISMTSCLLWLSPFWSIKWSKQSNQLVSKVLNTQLHIFLDSTVTFLMWYLNQTEYTIMAHLKTQIFYMSFSFYQFSLVIYKLISWKFIIPRKQ